MKRQKYTTSKALYDKACEYFNSQDIPTLAGLVLYLGYETKSSFLLEKENEKLSYGVNLSLLKLEDINGRALYDKNLSAGAKFVLENEFKQEERVSDTQIQVRVVD